MLMFLLSVPYFSGTRPKKKIGEGEEVRNEVLIIRASFSLAENGAGLH